MKAAEEKKTAEGKKTAEEKKDCRGKKAAEERDLQRRKICREQKDRSEEIAAKSYQCYRRNYNVGGKKAADGIRLE